MQEQIALSGIGIGHTTDLPHVRLNGRGTKNLLATSPLTRKQETEESYCDFDQSSWENITAFTNMNTWELIRTYGRMLRERDRRERNHVKNFLRDRGVF
jgi:hypothetical protein